MTHHPALVELLREVSSTTDRISKSNKGSDLCQRQICDHKANGGTHSKAVKMKVVEPFIHQTNHVGDGVQSPHPEGMGSLEIKTLRALVAPIYENLKAIDAVQLLSLERVAVNNGGAPIGNEIFVQPIHDQIVPPRNEYKNSSCVRYLQIAELSETYSIGIFVFPPYATIPLHDHPNMCVLSRILYGEVTKLSLDWERQSDFVSSQQQLSQSPLQSSSSSSSSRRSSWLSKMLWSSSNTLMSLRSSTPTTTATTTTTTTTGTIGTRRAYKPETNREVLRAPAVTILYPQQGNLHEFAAGPHGAAVLDVLLPPYDGYDRDCTYYSILEDEDSADPQACWVIPTGQPENFYCLSGTYHNLGLDEEEDDEDNSLDESM